MAWRSCIFFLLRSSVAAGAPVKVLPLGDSITFGCGDGCAGVETQCGMFKPSCQAGYRVNLWRKLSPNSSTSDEWDFVGTQHNGPDDIDRDHEGHPGWKNEEVGSISSKWLATNPDVILLHLGTNNMGIGFQQAPAALEHMNSLLNLTLTNLPKVRLLLSTIIGSTPYYGGNQHAPYNAGLKQFVLDYKAKGFAIELVDMAVESGIGEFCDDVNCNMGNLHPNMKGYDMMANVWYKHLTGKSFIVV